MPGRGGLGEEGGARGRRERSFYIYIFLGRGKKKKRGGGGRGVDTYILRRPGATRFIYNVLWQGQPGRCRQDGVEWNKYGNVRTASGTVAVGTKAARTDIRTKRWGNHGLVWVGVSRAERDR